MNETPTPRTDEAAVDVWRKSNGERMETSSDKVDADFARKLERELATVTTQRDEAREYAGKLAEGLPDGMLPKDVEVLREANLGLATELATVTAQRDEIDSMYHKIIKEVLECDPIPACKREDDHLEPPWEVVARIREQRDRLVEALQKLRNNESMSLGGAAYEIVEQTLQSLTQNAKL
jgi:hypothetical protein